MPKQCAKCKVEEYDLRTLWMASFYAMEELNIPFEIEELFETSDQRENGILFYTLSVCKNCRADWMRSIQYWFNTDMPRESCGSGIYVRDFGSNREVTLEEYREKYDNEK
jgi:hypothetical protein